MRHAERRRVGRVGAALPELQGTSFSARRSGGDHARSQRASDACSAEGCGAPARGSRASPVSWSRARPWRRRCAAKSSKNPIRVGRVRYLASQPWPFPSTLMIGCLAEALSEEITIDPEELAEARWFERDEVRAMVERSRSDDPVPVLRHCRRRWPSAIRSPAAGPSASTACEAERSPASPPGG